MLPEAYDTPEKVMTGMQYAVELGLKPLISLRQISVIKGTPSIFGDLPLALVRRSGQLQEIKEWIFDENSKEISLRNKNIANDPFGAACRIKRKGYKEREFVFTIKDAIQAGLPNKDNWKNYPKTMLKYRARSIALKDQFSDALDGVSIMEYDHNELHNDGRGPVSPTAEIAESREKDFSPEKLELIQDIKKIFDKLKFNDAQIIRYTKQYAQCEDIFYATEENLDSLLVEMEHIRDGK